MQRVEVGAYRIPTEEPEADGTFAWDSTTLVAVWVSAADAQGFGYTYADTATARLIVDTLAPVLEGLDALDIPRAWDAMVRRVRNLGRPGIASMAIAAVDVALWDLKARILGLPLARLLGQVREAIPIYASGGFTSYSDARMERWCEDVRNEGARMAKIKVGTDPERDPDRVHVARRALGDEVHLFVDANGAYTRKQALALAEAFADEGVTWFEEPVSSDDLEGLRLIRDRAPAGMAIAAGEYGYDLPYFRRMLEAGSVDVLQADASRCAGISEFLRAAALAAAEGIPLSSHCAPALHLASMCAVSNAIHVEYFHDHQRIERMLFDGVVTPERGMLAPDLARPGLGIEFKRTDAARFAL